MIRGSHFGKKALWGAGLFLFAGILDSPPGAFGKSKAVGAVSPAPSCPLSMARESKSGPVPHYPVLERHLMVTWDTLSHFEVPDMDDEDGPKKDPMKKYPIPAFIQELDGKDLAVVGFMIPSETDEKDERAVSFFLDRTQGSCCYGIAPKLNEWIFVKMVKGKSADISMDVPVTVFGKMEVGMRGKVEEGKSLYRMVSEKVSIPKETAW